MSFQGDPSPFQTSFQPPLPKPAGAPQAAVSGDFRLEYMRAYNYIFENPNWMTNVMWGFLCILSSGVIPVIGQLVFLGYQYEVIEALLLTRGLRYPDFDVNRFGEYLGRSIWPFLVSLVSMLLFFPILMLGYFACFLFAAGGAALGGEDFGPVLAAMGFFLAFLILMLMIIGFQMVLMPMMLRAGLQQDFGAAFDFHWVTGFIKRTWVEMLLGNLFLMFSGMMLMMLGAIAFCIGMYAAMAVLLLATDYMHYQFYMLYLSRGGTPIPLKPRLPPPMQAPGFMPPGGYIPPPGSPPPANFGPPR